MGSLFVCPWSVVVVMAVRCAIDKRFYMHVWDFRGFKAQSGWGGKLMLTNNTTAEK